MTERAKSDVIGYVLVFALVVTAIGVLFATGLTGLTDVRDAGRVENAGYAYDLLAENVEDVAIRGAPSRATEMKLAEATLSTGDPVVVGVNISGGPNITRQTRPLLYESTAGPRFLYSNGAVLRADRGGAVVRRPPPLLFNSERTVVTIPQLRAADSSVGGSTTVLVRTVAAEREVLYRSSGPTTLTYTVTAPTGERAAAWERHLRETDATCTRSGTQVSCTLTASEQVVVRRVAIDTQLL